MSMAHIHIHDINVSDNSNNNNPVEDILLLFTSNIK